MLTNIRFFANSYGEYYRYLDLKDGYTYMEEWNGKQWITIDSYNTKEYWSTGDLSAD